MTNYSEVRWAFSRSGAVIESRECHHCHRIGTRAFVPWGSEGWECANDRVCNQRAARRHPMSCVGGGHEPGIT